MTYSLFNLKGNNCIAGAYLQNIGSGAIPVYGSLGKMHLVDVEYKDVVDAIFVVPGFKLIVYRDENYTHDWLSVDNRYGKAVYMNWLGQIGYSSNIVSSVRLYDYYNNEIIIDNSTQTARL